MQTPRTTHLQYYHSGVCNDRNKPPPPKTPTVWTKLRRVASTPKKVFEVSLQYLRDLRDVISDVNKPPTPSKSPRKKKARLKSPVKTILNPLPEVYMAASLEELSATLFQNDPRTPTKLRSVQTATPNTKIEAVMCAAHLGYVPGKRSANCPAECAATLIAYRRGYSRSFDGSSCQR